MRRAILAILAAVSLQMGEGEAQASPYFMCRNVHRGFMAAGDTTLYGFAPIWLGDGTGMVLAGYEVDLDQCSSSLDGFM